MEWNSDACLDISKIEGSFKNKLRLGEDKEGDLDEWGWLGSGKDSRKLPRGMQLPKDSFFGLKKLNPGKNICFLAEQDLLWSSAEELESELENNLSCELVLERKFQTLGSDKICDPAWTISWKSQGNNSLWRKVSILGNWFSMKERGDYREREEGNELQGSDTKWLH